MLKSQYFATDSSNIATIFTNKTLCATLERKDTKDFGTNPPRKPVILLKKPTSLPQHRPSTSAVLQSSLFNGPISSYKIRKQFIFRRHASICEQNNINPSTLREPIEAKWMSNILKGVSISGKMLVRLRKKGEELNKNSAKIENTKYVKKKIALLNNSLLYGKINKKPILEISELRKTAMSQMCGNYITKVRGKNLRYLTNKFNKKPNNLSFDQDSKYKDAFLSIKSLNNNSPSAKNQYYPKRRSNISRPQTQISRSPRQNTGVMTPSMNFGISGNSIQPFAQESPYTEQYNKLIKFVEINPPTINPIQNSTNSAKNEYTSFMISLQKDENSLLNSVVNDSKLYQSLMLKTNITQKPKHKRFYSISLKYPPQKPTEKQIAKTICLNKNSFRKIRKGRVFSDAQFYSNKSTSFIK